MGKVYLPVVGKEICKYLPNNYEFYEERPISTIVVKVASGCNLKCSYCYMYEHPDQTWREQPKFITDEITYKLGNRVREYILDRNLNKFLIVAHGGEPLLLGSKKLHKFFKILKQRINLPEVDVKFGIQTNGILVDEEIVKVLQEFDIRAGVSIDGPQYWNDRFRLNKKGEGTHDKILAGVEKLQFPKQGNSVFGGYLTVVNPQIAPSEILSFFESLNAPAVDFLLPDFNYDTFSKEDFRVGAFGEWLADLFDLWFYSKSTIEIRFFRILIKLILGGYNGFDSIGAISNGALIVETDGTYHSLDVLKTSYHGVTKTGKSLWDDSIRKMESAGFVMGLSNKKFSATEKCLDCKYFNVCGGGYLPHRYSRYNGFNNPSVFCDDLKIIISHINKRISNELKKMS